MSDPTRFVQFKLNHVSAVGHTCAAIDARLTIIQETQTEFISENCIHFDNENAVR